MGWMARGSVASLIDEIEGSRNDRRHPRSPTKAVFETLRFFLREGVQWRELWATADRASGSTLRRCLSEWSATALLRRAHAALVRMARSGPEAAAAAWDVVVDSCSVRAKDGGELTGPNPTDYGKPGAKYHVVVATYGILLATPPSAAADVHDTMLFPGLLHRTLVVCAAIARLYADAGYENVENRGLCEHNGILPLIRKIGELRRCGLGAVRCVVEHANAWLAYKRIDRRNERLAIIIDALLTAACIFVFANRLADY